MRFIAAQAVWNDCFCVAIAPGANHKHYLFSKAMLKPGAVDITLVVIKVK
jgi:hypothetical protein